MHEFVHLDSIFSVQKNTFCGLIYKEFLYETTAAQKYAFDQKISQKPHWLCRVSEHLFAPTKILGKGCLYNLNHIVVVIKIHIEAQLSPKAAYLLRNFIFTYFHTHTYLEGAYDLSLINKHIRKTYG